MCVHTVREPKSQHVYTEVTSGSWYVAEEILTHVYIRYWRFMCVDMNAIVGTYRGD